MNIVSLTISFVDFSFFLSIAKRVGVGEMMFLEQKGEEQKKNDLWFFSLEAVP